MGMVLALEGLNFSMNNSIAVSASPHCKCIMEMALFLEFLDQNSPEMLFNLFDFVGYFIIALFQIVNPAWSRIRRKKGHHISRKIIFGNQIGRGTVSFANCSGDAIFDWLPCLQLVYVQHTLMQIFYQ